MFEEYINSKKDEILENLNQMINKFLEIGKKLGFKTKNIDKYCGYIEFGEGQEMLGIIGHLDVVPEGEGWKHPPFELTIEDEKAYGRGTIDDKGPMIASLYAMKAIKDNAQVNKRVRMIIGLNEENDWKGIEYYKGHEEMPTLGFSPDADFPCIYSEKALLSAYTEEKYIPNEKILIKEIDCKNNRINVVPKFCSVKIEVSNEIEKELYNMLLNKKEIVFNQKENEFYIETHGIQAHAAHPELGENAISKMILILNEIYNKFGVENSTIKELASKIGKETNGYSLGISHKNKELGDLTLNLAQFNLKDDKLTSGMNLRIPKDCNLEVIKQKIIDNLPNLNVTFDGEKPALYIPKDNKLVKRLCQIYNDYTGENKEPLAIGGATFARAFNNCVSFGAMRPEEPDMCHQVDEYIKIQNLIDACNMYANAIYELTR